FLFESQRGYCDHFSSAMAVMLRSIGIPVRWVKGFAPGTSIGTDSNGVDTVEVRNRDAHSWVEVYFAGSGWIPFEATSTFISPIRINHDAVQQEQQMPVPVPDLGEHKAIDRGDGRLDQLEGNDSTGRSFKVPWQTYPIILLLFAGGGFFAYRRRRQIMYWWLQQQMSV
ncbi:transglutaminase-like domain-containing protein, partial [Frankia sp. Cpl3]|nr:transglutaminase-like domain-containing protein [Frankia sp. Cpl3]